MHTVLVTDAASGIGRTAARTFADISDALDSTILLGACQLAVSPELIATTIFGAATALNPAARYPVGLPARLAAVTRWLPHPVQSLGQSAASQSVGALERVRRAIGE
ncbi:hypothetical protein [Halorhabdus rudnickae]|uniref:hypothetical protein n=1 Tax=Halorhabdus rudnickae TaxID=1775544 RepID=UPI0010834AA3|nr:hypothetical protein [Halorhabdus rudnickae]